MLPILMKKQLSFFRIALVSSAFTLSSVFLMSIYDFGFTEVLWVLSIVNVLILIYILLWIVNVAGKGRKSIELNDENE